MASVSPVGRAGLADWKDAFERPLDSGLAARIASKPARNRYRVLLATGEMLSIALGIALASQLRNQDALDHQAVSLLPVIMPLYLATAMHQHAYSLRALTSSSVGLRRALLALALTVLFMMALGFAFKVSADYSRTVLIVGPGIAAAGIGISRMLVGRAVAQARAKGGLVDEVVLCDGMMLLPQGKERVLNATALGLQPRADCPHMLDRIGRTLEHADRVIVVCAPEARLAWTAALKGLGINVEVLIPEIEALGVLAARDYHGRLTAVVAKGPLGAQDKIAKRAFDLLVLVWLLPMLLVVTAVVAVLIKLDDGGPVFFTQKRIGQGNRLFSMYKFRSMRVAQLDSDGRVSATRDDSRVTRVGRFLRRTSVDELPQLFNVLLGDMSIVGPRPHALASTAGDALFWDVDHRYWWRHAAKPGLTGLAQVRGFRGATATAEDLTNRVQSDLEYLAGWSLARDVRILFATLRVILHPNAF